MKITTLDEIRSCGNICGNLGARLEMALAVAKPDEEAPIRQLMTEHRKLSLAIERFGESLRSCREEALEESKRT